MRFDFSDIDRGGTYRKYPWHQRKFDDMSVMPFRVADTDVTTESI